MSDIEQASTGGTPWHIWLVGLLAVGWNTLGATDYVFAQMMPDFYVEAMRPEQVVFIEAIPAWAVSLWALAVWGSLAGSVLILARSRFAYPVFVVATACMVGAFFRNYLMADGIQVQGSMGVAMAMVLFLIQLFLLYYTRDMTGRGILR